MTNNKIPQLVFSLIIINNPHNNNNKLISKRKIIIYPSDKYFKLHISHFIYFNISNEYNITLYSIGLKRVRATISKLLIYTLIAFQRSGFRASTGQNPGTKGTFIPT